jgi:hypothetical protein
LRAVASRHLAPGALECRLELGELLHRAVGPHAVIPIVNAAVAGECRLELAGKKPFLLRASEVVMAFGCISVGARARYVEHMGKDFGGLSHVQLDQRIGKPAL